MTGATITVCREDEEIEVEVEGQFENVSSYNPNECGERLYDWDVIAPTGFVLTAKETELAVQALYDNHARG